MSGAVEFINELAGAFASHRRVEGYDDGRVVDVSKYEEGILSDLECIKKSRGNIPKLISPDRAFFGGANRKQIFDSWGLRLLHGHIPVDYYLDEYLNPGEDDPYREVRLRMEMVHLKPGEKYVLKSEIGFSVIFSGKFEVGGEKTREKLAEDQLFVGPLRTRDGLKNVGNGDGNILVIKLDKRTKGKFELAPGRAVVSISEWMRRVYEGEKDREPGIMRQSNAQKIWFAGPRSNEGAGKIKGVAIGAMCEPHVHLEDFLVAHPFSSQVVVSLPTDLSSGDIHPIFSSSVNPTQRDVLPDFTAWVSGGRAHGSTKFLPPNRFILMAHLFSGGNYLKEPYVDPYATSTWAGELMRRLEKKGVKVHDAQPELDSDIAVMRATREPRPGLADPRDCNSE